MGYTRSVYYAAPLAIIIAATSLQAQDTQCTTFNNITNCHTTPGLTMPVQPPVFQPAPPPDYSGYAALGLAIRAKRERAHRRKVGEMIANGDCNGARNAALKDGDFRLAETVNEICITKLPIK